MKPIDSIASSTTQKHANAPRSGGQKPLLNNEQHSSNESKPGKQQTKPESSLLTKEEACRILNCHWQTLLYREKSGQLSSIRIGRRKYYAVGEVKQLLKHNPVHNKPHWSKRAPVKPTLWQRIKALFV